MLIDKNKIEWVWVDLDDTLWDFETNSIESLKETYRHFQLQKYFQSEEEFCEKYLEVNHALWADYNVRKISRDYLMRERFQRPLLEAGYPVTDTIWKEFSDYYLECLGKCTLTVPGAHELLMKLRAQGFKIGIISNGFKEVQYNKLDSSNLSHLIDCVTLSDEIGVNKPDRRLFDHALAKAGATAEKSIIIGDNPDTDILGGINAGWDVIYFNRDGRHKPLTNVPTITKLNEL